MRMPDADASDADAGGDPDPDSQGVPPRDAQPPPHHPRRTPPHGRARTLPQPSQGPCPHRFLHRFLLPHPPLLLPSAAPALPYLAAFAMLAPIDKTRFLMPCSLLPFLMLASSACAVRDPRVCSKPFRCCFPHPRPACLLPARAQSATDALAVLHPLIRSLPCPPPRILPTPLRARPHEYVCQRTIARARHF
jgi:hypothetical protein